jgi:ribonuclease VapC
MSDVVLDASAVLAYLNEEPGADRVAPLLEQGGAVISSVNWAETAGRLLALGLPEATAREILRSLELRVLPLDQETAWLAATLLPPTRPFGLSLGDRCCLALGLRLGLPVMTADRVWEQAGVGVEVRVIR